MRRIRLLIVLCPTVAAALAAEPVGKITPTSFTYVGQFRMEGRPLTQSCDFEFSLWRKQEGNAPHERIGSPMTFDGKEGNPRSVAVEQGVFAVRLDFGEEAFSGQTCYLDIQVRCQDQPRFVRFTPRVRITPKRDIPESMVKKEEKKPEPIIQGIPVTMPAEARNTAPGRFATVVGGKDNEAAAPFSFAAGRGAKIAPEHGGTFVWADSNGNAEYGKSFISTGVDQFLIRAAGGVGIGTNQPKAPLDVAGAIRNSAADPATILVHGTSDTGKPDGDGFRIRYQNAYFGGSAGALIFEKTNAKAINSDSGIVFMNTGSDGDEKSALVVKGDGRVGIGTLRPEAQLHVCGDVKVTGDLVTDTGLTCPDYVFEKGYVLRTLQEVREFIGRARHLPDMPPGDEIDRDGVRIGDFSLRLLRKVEELTLYLIEQDEQQADHAKKIEALTAQLDGLRKQNANLEARLARLEHLATNH